MHSHVFYTKCITLSHYYQVWNIKHINIIYDPFSPWENFQYDVVRIYCSRIQNLFFLLKHAFQISLVTTDKQIPLTYVQEQYRKNLLINSIINYIIIRSSKILYKHSINNKSTLSGIRSLIDIPWAKLLDSREFVIADMTSNKSWMSAILWSCYPRVSDRKPGEKVHLSVSNQLLINFRLCLVSAAWLSHTHAPFMLISCTPRHWKVLDTRNKAPGLESIEYPYMQYNIIVYWVPIIET